jgi:cell division protein FtsB
MRIITLLLVLLIAALQWPMWLGKGGWYRVWQVDKALRDQRISNASLMVRNAALAAEVMDLKTGTDAIEERARSELGMIKKDEVFFHILEKRNKITSKPKNTSIP